MTTTTRQRTAPSRVARAMAAATWPDVQHQTKLGPGVFDFSCAGHGGIVAVLNAANFPPEVVEVAREHGKTELIVYGFGGFSTTERYTRESLAEWADAHGFPQWEVWIGEEDCDWALLVVADPTLAGPMARGWRKTPAEVAQYARENAERWNPDVLAALDRAMR